MIDVSIIVPVYNVETYLEKCLDSLVCQSTATSMEIILVDDGSTDKSGSICDTYARQFDYIKTIHKSNGGVSSARNIGIDVATGDYIAFVDADDYVENAFYESMLSEAKLTNADLVVFDYWLTYNDKKCVKYRKELRRKSWTQKEALKEFLSGGTIGINLFDKLFKREIIRNIRFDEKIRIGEDLYFIFEFLMNARIVYSNPIPGYHYLQRDGSAMKTAFGEKYFDVLIVTERIKIIISNSCSDLIRYAEALYIHTEYKTLERSYKFYTSSTYRLQLDKCEADIKHYSCIDAFRYLSLKRFLGFCLIRLSPLLYINVCRIMKI